MRGRIYTFTVVAFSGFELPYLAVQNEPDLGPGCPNGPPISVEDHVIIVKRLGARMRAEGLATQIIFSDGRTPQNALRCMQAALADPDALYFKADGALDHYEISTDDYLLGHYSRFVVPGSVGLKHESGDLRVRVTAFERPDGGW